MKNPSEVRFNHFELVSSYIFEEMMSNDMDAVEVVCKNGVRLPVSKTLLAILSPYLAEVMKNVDCEDCEIYLPDIMSYELKDLINFILNQNSGNEVKVKVLQIFDGILWKRFPGLVLDNDDDNFLEEDSFQLEFFDNIKEEKQETEDIKCEGQITDCSILLKRCKYSDLETPTNFNNEDGKKAICKVEIEESETIDNHEIDSSTSENKRMTRKRKVPTEADPDFVVKSEVESDPKRKKRGRYKKRKLKTKIKNKTAFKLQQQDETFRIAQEKLKEDMLNNNNVDDPAILWFKYHELDSRIYLFKHQAKEPKLICPVCCEMFPSGTSGKGFFTHLREHKIASFQCTCTPTEDKVHHLKVEHWKFIVCKYCNLALDGSRYQHHLSRRHPDVDRTASCHFCGFSSSNVESFKEHMDKQHYQVKTCTCRIKFESRKHREHHLQKVHLKENLTCDKTRCYFMCESQEELQDHKNNHAKFDLPPLTVVCDICGEEAKNITYHKRSQHDTVKHSCPICDKQFNEYSLKGHMKKVHTQQICTICGAKVKSLYSHHLNMHISYEEAKYKCDICKRPFSGNSALQQHMMNVHLKERPYNCRYGCSVAYNDVSNRNQHEKRRHGQVFNSLKQEMKSDINV